jgi:hypothetical protein
MGLVGPRSYDEVTASAEGRLIGPSKILNTWYSTPTAPPPGTECQSPRESSLSAVSQPAWLG